MRITRLECQGLYSYREPVSVNVSDRVVIVGPNNSGKSNLFKMIKLFTDTLLESSTLKESQMSKGARDSRLELHIKLSKDETGRIVDFCSFFVPDDQGTRFYEYKNRDQLTRLLDELSVRIFWGKTAKYGIQTIVEIEFVKMALVIYGNMRSTLYISDRPDHEPDASKIHKTKLLHDLLSKLSDQASAKKTTKEFFQDKILEMPRPEDHHRIPEHARRMLAGLQSYLGIPDPDGKRIEITQLVGEILAKGIVHSPDSRHVDEADIQASAESLKVLPDQEGVLGNESGQYNSWLRRVARFKQSVPAETLADDGSNLSSFLLGLKTSPVLADRKRLEAIQRAFESVFEYEKLKFDVILEPPEYEHDSSGRAYVRRIFSLPVTMIRNESGEEFSIADAGAGVRESIYLLALVMGSSDSAILLDEPSINMHPGLARAVLGEICSNDENQILITTHAPEIVGFVVFENSSKVLYVRNAGWSTVETLDGEAFERFDEDRGRLRYLIDPAIFFAKCVVLVEGPSDQSLLAGVAEYKAREDQKYNLARKNIAILHINGKGNFEKYIDLLDAYKIPYVILADRDDGNKRKKWFENRKTAEFPSDCKSSIGADIVLIEKNLERMLVSIDERAFKTAKKIGGCSKIAVAIEFCKIIQKNRPQKLCRVTAFLDYCIGRGSEEAGGAKKDRVVPPSG